MKGSVQVAVECRDNKLELYRNPAPWEDMINPLNLRVIVATGFSCPTGENFLT